MSEERAESVAPRPSARTSRGVPPHGEGDLNERYCAAFPGRMRRITLDRNRGVSLRYAQGPYPIEIPPTDTHQPLPLTASDDSIDELEEMLLSSTLNKLRSFGPTSSAHEKRAHPHSDWYRSTLSDRTDAIYSPLAPSSTLSPLTDSKKLQSGPVRRGYIPLTAHTSASATTKSRSVPTDQADESDLSTSPASHNGVGRARRLEANNRSSRPVPERGRPSQAASFSDTFRRADGPSPFYEFRYRKEYDIGGDDPEKQEYNCQGTPSEPLATLALPDSSPRSGHPPSLTLTISTSLDSSGHRVLASRRRHSAPSSPVKCRKIKTAFGVGEEGQGQREQLYSGTLTSIPYDDGGGTHTHSVRDERQSETGESPSERLLRSSPNAHRPRSIGNDLPYLPKRRLSRHVPIDTFTPPPPLDAHASGRLAALANLGRSGTHPSPVSSDLPNSSSGSISRRLSLGRRPTLKRFSLPNSPALPPLSPTFAPERFAVAVIHSGDTSESRSHPSKSLERNSSHGSTSTLDSTSTASMPPTPQDTSPLLPLAEVFCLTSAGMDRGPEHVSRPHAPTVTFAIPSDRVAEPQKSSNDAAYFDRRDARSHRRAAWAAAALEATYEYDSVYPYLEREYAPLTVTNPDRPDSSVSFAIAHSPVEIGLAF